MELTLKQNPVMDKEIENWDDDDLEISGDDFISRAASITTTTTHGRSHRDSISSRLSIQSDFNSNQGDDERRVHLPGDDERSTNDAIAAATRAGIPIPQNVPPSALMGGTIKRLGGRRIKKIIQQDDWDDDLELPKTGEDLKIKRPDSSNFPDVLRQVSAGSTQTSPSRGLQPAPVFGFNMRPILKPKTASANLNLDRYRDDDDDDFFGDGCATIKVSKNRPPKPLTRVVPPTPQKKTEKDDDDFEADLQLPANGEPLKLSVRRDIPKTPISAQDDFDEWGEGSLGTRFGGTRRDGRSNRSSSVSALSPSVSSSITIESEDEGLDGLVLPAGPINFDEILKKRQQTISPEHEPVQKPALKRVPEQDDFLSGLEIGDGDVFTSSKLTLKRNIIVKPTRTTSPTRPKAAVSLVFTNKPSVNPRIPRPHGQERVPPSLEPVSESGGPIQNRAKRSQSRLGGHSAQSSITSIPTPTTPSSAHSLPPNTPRRHNLAAKPSLNALRNEPTTTSAQLLKLKRSMPILRSHPQSPAKSAGSRYERPPSRTETSAKPNSVSRPKTPVERDRSGAESSLSHARRNPMPFLPAGASQAQSHHVTIKAVRHFRRHDSESSNNSVEPRPTSRAVSRSTMRSPSPPRPARLRGAEALARAASTKQQITKPRRPRHFGDGFELDGFDDLPTSQFAEQKFVKQPVGRGGPKSLLRNKIIQNVAPDRITTPTPTTPYSPIKQDHLPRFARDTNASRIAREQVRSQRTPSGSIAPLTTVTSQWKPQVTARTSHNTITTQSPKAKRSRPPVQQKPHLIKPLGNMSSNPKSVKGMVYNPATYVWEGNENDLSPFDAPSNSPSVASVPHLLREKENTTPRPALITNINASQGVQVVGGMVFDPQRMCWLKVTPGYRRDQSHGGRSEASTGDVMDNFDAFEDDEEDVFKGIGDLEENSSRCKEECDEYGVGVGRMKTGLTGAEVKDDWLVGEEFDVGPEFVRRQREEEERWRRKCEKWIGPERDALNDMDWRWKIRYYVTDPDI